MSATELKTELDERDRIAAKYPDWHLWVSSASRPWATRRGKIIPPLGNDSQKDPRWRMTIDADTWPELEEILEQQTELDTRMLLRLPRGHREPLAPWEMVAMRVSPGRLQEGKPIED